MATLIDAAPVATKEKRLVGAELAARTRAFKKAEELRQGFLDRLRDYRVLDPACGSGNFLYIALTELKNIEHRANLEAEALGLQRPALQVVGPENVLGIELNPYAAELARVSVWIGEIQWMRRNGFEAARNPILRTLTNIENRDAVLNPDGTQAEWPKADAVVGNPPFLGASKILSELGADYTIALRNAWDGIVPGFADLVCYWFAKAWAQMQVGQLARAGLVSTNSIRGGANRAVLRKIVEDGRIFDAWSDEPWTVEGAAVRVSLVCFDKSGGRGCLNGNSVERVLSDLTANELNFDLTTASQLSENYGFCIRGIETGGPFEMDAASFEFLLTRPTNPNGKKNSQVLRRVLNGSNILKGKPARYVIDFGPSATEEEAALFEEPYKHLKNAYLSYGKNQKRKFVMRSDWWIHRRTGGALRNSIAGKPRYIVTPRVGKYRIFVWLEANAIADSAAFAIARDDDTTFGILHSRFHELWALRMGTSLEDRPRYTPSTTFETFPFPEGLTPNIPAADYASDPRAQKIAAAAARLNELRENWLNPSDLVDRVPEVVPGYPDRLLPKNAAAAAELKKRTLTNLYNARPTWLDHAHRALDQAVAEAYGWGDDWRAGKLTDDEILARLFRLNQERAEAEKKKG